MERFFTAMCLLGLLSACAAHDPAPAHHPVIDAGAGRAPSVGSDQARPPATLRQGRYTLVNTEPDRQQRDLLAQIIDVTLAPALSPSVQDALRYVLRRSGYSLCPATGLVKILFSQTLPAAHYRLGPLPLRSALQVMAGPAWQLTTDEVHRSVCFAPRQTAPSAAPISAVLPRHSEAWS
jgi:type IV pili sensor histidine kinase/response regulator